MFRLLKLSPPHGWRSVWWELGIVTLGVLIALGAGELAQKLNWNEQVEQAEVALDAQLVESQFAAFERIAGSDCKARILDELDDLIAGKPHTRQLNLSFLGTLRPWSTSAWEAASASGAVAHMNRDRRSLYSDLFHFTRLLGEMNRKEFEVASDVKTLQRHKKLTETSRDRLSRNVSQLRAMNAILTLGARQWLEGAKPLRLKFSAEEAKELKAVQSAPCPLDTQA